MIAFDDKGINQKRFLGRGINSEWDSHDDFPFVYSR
jgi:hypothetical protein